MGESRDLANEFDQLQLRNEAALAQLNCLLDNLCTQFGQFLQAFNTRNPRKRSPHGVQGEEKFDSQVVDNDSRAEFADSCADNLPTSSGPVLPPTFLSSSFQP